MTEVLELEIIDTHTKSYEYPVYSDMELTLNNARKVASEVNKLDLDNVILVYRGSSGSTIASLMYTYLIKKPEMYYVRKENENDHYSGVVPGGGFDNLIIVDDFISTGETMEAIAMDLGCHTQCDRVIAVCAKKSTSESKQTSLRSLFPNLRYIIV